MFPVSYISWNVGFHLGAFLCGLVIAIRMGTVPIAIGLDVLMFQRALIEIEMAQLMQFFPHLKLPRLGGFLGDMFAWTKMSFRFFGLLKAIIGSYLVNSDALSGSSYKKSVSSVIIIIIIIIIISKI